jgi:hypothetical protein
MKLNTPSFGFCNLLKKVIFDVETRTNTPVTLTECI